RKHFEHRLAVVADDTEHLRRALRALGDGPAVLGEAGAVAPKVAFLFSGQGSQYAAMAKELYATEPVFREALDACAAELELGRPLLDILADPDPAVLRNTAITQPALFALEYALVQQWRAWGVEPHALLGHSVGEYVAACVAGVFSLSDGLRLITERGRLMQEHTREGVMAAVRADE